MLQRKQNLGFLPNKLADPKLSDCFTIWDDLPPPSDLVGSSYAALSTLQSGKRSEHRGGFAVAVLGQMCVLLKSLF